MLAVLGPRAQAPLKPAYSFKGHRDEGFALDWSRVTAGRLATGDCAGSIHVWNQAAGASAAAWAVDPAPFKGHAGSVEDIQWSPTEATVFASASADRTVKIWDTRGRTGPQISVDAHGEDVNVISWNPSVAYLLASGSDDGTFKVTSEKSNNVYIRSFLWKILSAFTASLILASLQYFACINFRSSGLGFARHPRQERPCR